MINTEEKKTIHKAFIEKLGKIKKKNKQDKGLGHAANQIKVSKALLSQIYNENWEQVSDEAWRMVANWVELQISDWTVVETTNFKRISGLLEDAQTYSECYGIIGEAGCGKTKTFQYYAANNDYAYLLQCNEFWNRKHFLRELMRSMGLDSAGLSIAEMIEVIKSTLNRLAYPIVIMDEMDKVNDTVLQMFISLFNMVENNCGLVIAATNHLEKRILRGIELNRKGYNEIYSRIGRRFVKCAENGSHDIAQICHANGVSNNDEINDITKEAGGDLRRVVRRVKKFKKQNFKKAA